jgi:hypothetical protein
VNLSLFPNYRFFRPLTEWIREWTASPLPIRCPVVETATKLAEDGPWTGTATELLEWCRFWWPDARHPGSPSRLSRELRAAAQFLRDERGVDIRFRTTHRERLIDIRLV